ncbi:MAG: 4-alpha-glucanotransferase [Puniceicoccales bacterium]|jgi:4-alpha-glucanotransferase|nr:4-alpha-glucanotransferase [Puniceicoccales bacterium]
MAVWSWLKDRACGVFLHVSSLPSKQGIGCFGKSAYDFVEFLSAAAVKYWQVCPLNPTSFGDSPYQSPSAFAGNPYFIDINDLVEIGLLSHLEIETLESLPHSNVDFGGLYEHFWPLLRTAFANFTNSHPHWKEFENYCKKASWWLDNYAIFMAIKDKFCGKQWTEWPKEFLNFENAKVCVSSDYNLKKSTSFHKFTQWLFDVQWKKLKAFANKNGIFMVGDVQIFVGLDSSDVFSNRRMFKLQQNGMPKFVTGVPPDLFSDTGQLWGNPVYDWDVLRNNNFSWWTGRIRRCLELYDVVRLDHFRGFCDYWEITYPATTAINGKWIKSAGIKFFECIKNTFPNSKFIAEDLGILTDNVSELLKQTGLPGMNVIHFAFDGNSKNKYLLHEHDKNSVLYLGTHDNDTTLGWYRFLPDEIKHQVRSYFRTSGDDIAWDLIKAAYSSTSNILVISMQDILNLGSEARMNKPSTTSGNWQWRMMACQMEELKHGTANFLAELGRIYGR